MVAYVRSSLLVATVLLAACASPPPSVYVDRPQPPVAGQVPAPAAPTYRPPATPRPAVVRDQRPPVAAPQQAPQIARPVQQQPMPMAQQPASPAYAAVSADPLDAAVYRLGSGDTVRVEVLGEAELTLDALIDPSGQINYPFLGTVRAAGETVRGLELKIRNGLRGGYLVNPDVRVSLAAYRPVFISGQVKAPGSYPYSLGLNVERAITLAGGLSPFGSTSRIYRQRNGAVGDGDRTKVSMDSAVLPGDYIIVDERLF